MPPPVYLNVAEKPSVARELTKALGGVGTPQRQGMQSGNQVFDFGFMLQGQQVKMVVTSVRGHMTEMRFGPETSDWRGYPTEKLFKAKIHKEVKNDMRGIDSALQQEARAANYLVCWLDCDREGENISYEVIDTCRKANPNLYILRARFSSLTTPHLTHAMNTLGPPDQRSAEAVDARQEIDIRVGYAFTRLQTINLQDKFGMEDKVSYGGCQFPTLGFIVSRHWEREGFVPERFWKINMQHQNVEGNSTAPPVTVSFRWARERIFDQATSAIFYERCVQNPTARIADVKRKRKHKYKPLPLSTVELQKLASRHLRFTSEKTMRLAEELYNETLLSYPRTETDRFNMSEEELHNLIRPHVTANVQNTAWYAPLATYASSLLVPNIPFDAPGGYFTPNQGRNDDKAHPPIHPTKPAPHLDGEKKQLYELVTRHFLACCSKNACADEVVVTAVCGGERFFTSGQTIAARNYLDIYTYDRWGNSSIPNYQEGDTFEPTRLTLDDSSTTAPALLSEPDLIATMDKNGIGTDATIAQHIKTIKDRGYVQQNGLQFSVTNLGLALVQAYDEMGFAMLALPKMRAEMEKDLVCIVRGEKTRQHVVEEHVEKYRLIFRAATQKVNVLISSVGRWFQEVRLTAAIVQDNYTKCGKCRSPNRTTILKKVNDKVRILCCHNCSDVSYNLPRGSLAPHEKICPLCNFQVITVTNDKNVVYTVCPHCFANPPHKVSPTSDTDIEEQQSMRCFQCHHHACELAKGAIALRKCHCGGSVGLTRGKVCGWRRVCG